jgi:hypothetical protein
MILMGVFSELGNAASSGGLGAIPKSDAAYEILKAPAYNNMGDISWKTGETYGILFSGAVVGMTALLLFNRYYK